MFPRLVPPFWAVIAQPERPGLVDRVHMKGCGTGEGEGRGEAGGFAGFGPGDFGGLAPITDHLDLAATALHCTATSPRHTNEQREDTTLFPDRHFKSLLPRPSSAATTELQTAPATTMTTTTTTAAPSPPKHPDSFSLHSLAQDSAVHLTDAASDMTAPVPLQQQQQQHHPISHDEPEEEQEFDQYDNSSDSGWGSDSLVGDDTYTLASSIMNYRLENGRQYHAYRDGAYWVGEWCVDPVAKPLTASQGPNDEHAKEILDFAHHMYLLTLDHKLHLAPLKNPQVGLRSTAAGTAARKLERGLTMAHDR